MLKGPLVTTLCVVYYPPKLKEIINNKKETVAMREAHRLINASIL